MKKSRLMIAGSAISLALFSSLPAFAQETQSDDTAAPAAEDDDAEEEGTSKPILVTGSRIARPTLNSSVPITSVTPEDILSGGDLSVGDALNDLPALRSTFSQSNSTRFIGTAGQNVLDLRGLGTSRTLTLINGRRHVTVSPGDYLVDVNTIPAELIERIDVVTGGNSAIYGSDAVAGVVNFILKRDFDGLRFTGQGGASTRGDRGSYFASGTYGKNFADGRGNIAVSAEFSKSEALKFTQRDYLSGAFSGRKQFNLTEPTGGEPAAGDGIIDTAFFTNVRNNNISDGGLIGGVCNAALIANSARCAPGSTARQFFGTNYVFDAGGNLIQNPIERDLRFVGSNNALGGLGSTLSNYGDLIPDIDRRSINVLAHFDVSDAFKPFIEAKYVDLNVFSESSPSFFQGSIPGFFGAGQNFRCDNPFLTAQAYGQLQTIGRCSTTVPFGAVNPTTFNLAGRNNVDLGIRSEDNTRETWRIVGGVEGTFNDDWRYEVALNYGKLDGVTTSVNNLQIFNLDGSNGPFLNAIDATRNVAGQIVCRINAITVTDPNCVPLNLFGGSRSDPRAIDYVMTDSFYGQKATEFVASAFLNGDFSQLFELPGGPIGFVVGAEYREEKGEIVVDDLTASGATFLTALQPVKYPKLTVKEAFGELNFPILADLPFAQALEIGVAGRVSDYNTSAGTTYAYNITGVYSPIEDVKFRASYARSVRTPTQSDLFDPLGQNFAFISDPCDTLFISGGPNRAANCTAAGVPVGFVNTPARSATLSFQQGGNSLLTAEKSDSYTVGVVVEPSFAPGLSLTVDYYNITVNDLIATLGAQQIINLCYDSADFAGNPYCPLVSRLPSGEFDDPAVTAGPVNFAKQKTSGIDIDLAYNHTFDNGDRMNYRVIGSWVRARNNFTDPTDPAFANRIKSELGDPAFEVGANVSYRTGDITLRYEFRYIGPQTIGTYEAQNSFQGRPPTNADQFAQVYYKAVTYHDIRANFSVADKMNFYLGMDNVFDKKPPFNLLGTGAGSAIFDATGRYMYAGFRVDF